MNWATLYIAKLKNGETVSFFDNNVTFAPVSAHCGV